MKNPTNVTSCGKTEKGPLQNSSELLGEEEFVTAVLTRMLRVGTGWTLFSPFAVESQEDIKKQKASGAATVVPILADNGLCFPE